MSYVLGGSQEKMERSRPNKIGPFALPPPAAKKADRQLTGVGCTLSQIVYCHSCRY